MLLRHDGSFLVRNNRHRPQSATACSRARAPNQPTRAQPPFAAGRHKCFPADVYADPRIAASLNSPDVQSPLGVQQPRMQENDYRCKCCFAGWINSDISGIPRASSDPALQAIKRVAWIVTSVLGGVRHGPWPSVRWRWVIEQWISQRRIPIPTRLSPGSGTSWRRSARSWRGFEPRCR